MKRKIAAQFFLFVFPDEISPTLSLSLDCVNLRSLLFLTNSALLVLGPTANLNDSGSSRQTDFRREAFLL